MKTTIKIVISHLLIAMMWLMPQIALGLNVTVDYLTYDINSSTHTATFTGIGLDWSSSGPTTKYIENLSIPDKISYEGETYTVTTIGRWAMMGCSKYVSGTLTLPNTITTIEDFAFSDCDNLTGSLTIPNSVVTIGKSAFDLCKGFDGELILSSALTTIGSRAFYGCMFTGTLVIPDQVTTIGERAFYMCSGLKTVEIGNSVTTIEELAFWACKGLTNLKLSNSLTAIESKTFQFCDGLNCTIVIPNSVTRIGANAFESCHNIKGLKLGESLAVIEDKAFYNCKEITGELVLPNSLTTIGEYAFMDCRKLSGNLILPNSLTSLGLGAFANCQGINGILKIPESITHIEPSVFIRLGIEELYLPHTMEAIARGAITSKNLKLVVCEATNPPTRLKVEDDEFEGNEGMDYIFDIIGNENISDATLLVPAESIELYKASRYWNDFYQIKAIGSDIPASGITLDNQSVSLHIGETIELNARITPENATDKSVTWTSSNKAVATVDNNGKISAVATGGATITATAASGVSASCTVTVLPRETAPITVTRSEEKMVIKDGETAEMSVSVTGGYPEGLTFSWSNAGNIIGSGSSLKVVGHSNGNEKSNEIYTVRVIDKCDGVVIFDKTYRFEVETWPLPAENITISSDGGSDNLKIREGNRLQLSAIMPDGGYEDNWTYKWYLDGAKISSEQELCHEMTMPSGKDMGTTDTSVTLTATNHGPDGNVWGEATSAPIKVTVYRRPLTPQQLLRKGDGTTHTLIAMSRYKDDELDRLGYTFVYGYTDNIGEDHILAATGNRYCRIDESVFNNESFEKWCYSQWTYADGSVVTSGKRYLDGETDEDFDASVFSRTANHKKWRDFTDSNNWIRNDGKGINITIETMDNAKVEIFTTSGMLVDSVEIPANTFVSVNYSTDSLAPDFYIVSITSAGQRVVKKVIIK